MNTNQLKRKPLNYLVLLVFAAISIGSCFKDNSQMVTKTYELETINGIALSLPATVEIIEGDVQKVEISGREVTIEQINKQIKRGLWNIELPNSFRKNVDGLYIKITSNDIEKLILSGSGKIKAEHSLPLSSVTISGSGSVEAKTEASELESKISGSGRFTVAGKTTELSHQASGSGKFNGFDLETRDAVIEISGSARTELTVTNNLDVKISGSGNVYYKGKPTIASKVSGSGKVIESN